MTCKLRRLLVVLAHTYNLRSCLGTRSLLVLPSLWSHQHENHLPRTTNFKEEPPTSFRIGISNSFFVSTKCPGPEEILGADHRSPALCDSCYAALCHINQISNRSSRFRLLHGTILDLFPDAAYKMIRRSLKCQPIKSLKSDRKE